MIKVTVINFTPGSIASDQTVCEGTAPAPFTSVAASGDGIKTYQWEYSINGIAFNNVIASAPMQHILHLHYSEIPGSGDCRQQPSEDFMYRNNRYCACYGHQL